MVKFYNMYLRVSEDVPDKDVSAKKLPNGRYQLVGKSKKSPGKKLYKFESKEDAIKY